MKKIIRQTIACASVGVFFLSAHLCDFKALWGTMPSCHASSAMAGHDCCASDKKQDTAKTAKCCLSDADARLAPQPLLFPAAAQKRLLATADKTSFEQAVFLNFHQSTLHAPPYFTSQVLTHTYSAHAPPLV